MLIAVDTFQPDNPPESPGLQDCVGFVPTPRGMATAPVGADAGYPALAAACYGAASVMALDGSSEQYAGTATKLYKLSAGVWSDVSRGGGYSLAVTDAWYFASIENSRLACNLDQVIQRSTGGAFADVSNSPQCEVVENVGLFAVAFNVIDGVWGTFPDAWWCCAEGDVTSWAPSAATQATRGRLYASPGPVRAAKALGAQIVAYKETGIYVGTYQGPPKVFGWELAPGGGGCVGKYAVCVVFPQDVPAHFVVGPRDLYLFDGNRPQSIGSGAVREWFFARLNPSYRQKTACVVDYFRGLVYVLFANQSSSGTLNDCLVWNYKSGKWGRARDYGATHGCQFVTPTATFDSLTSATFDALVSPTFDTIGAQPSALAPSVMHSSQKLFTLSGTPASTQTSMFTTLSYGDEDTLTLVERVRPRCHSEPESAVLEHRVTDDLGDVPAVVGTATYANNRFDVLAEGRWHSESITFYGHTELNALSVTVSPVSAE